MKIELLDENNTAQWDDYVRANPEASFYHFSFWKDVIEDTFGHNTYYLASRSSAGELNGILPLVRLKSLLFGNFMVSMPFFNYGGVCADNDTAAAALLDEAIKVAEEEGASHIELRHTRNLFSGLPCKKSKVTMELGLPEDPDKLWKGLPSKLRSQIRRPKKDGMYAKVGGAEELDNFYDVFSRNMRDLGTPVYSKDFFRNILEALESACRVVTVYSKDHLPVASGFLTSYRGRVEIPWASSLREYNRSSPNMMLYWTSLSYACDSGCSVFDFGRSTPGEGTYRFKKQWGAEPRELYWHYWLKDGGELPDLSPSNSKFELAISIWKKLPVSLTRVIGPPIVKYLP